MFAVHIIVFHISCVVDYIVGFPMLNSAATASPNSILNVVTLSGGQPATTKPVDAPKLSILKINRHQF